VVASLQAQGWVHDRNLLVAGLLHDAGKSLAPPWAGYRVLVTALEALAPPLLTALAGRSAALHALTQHAASGADMAASAGLPPGVVRLIAEHHQPADARMAALQHADALH
jgi:putative nucleotidyltransferase with HDIG domain